MSATAPYLESTLVLIKPDALKNSLTGYVLSLLSEFHTGLRFAGAKVVHVTRMLAEEHYAEHVGKIFFPSLIEYITGKSHYPSAPHKQRVIALVYQGTDGIRKVRELCGPTNPLVAREQRPGCIRALGTLVPVKSESGEVVGQRMDNLIHASANEPDADREVKLWFRPSDIPPFMHAFETRQSAEHFYYTGGALVNNHVPGSVLILAPGDVAWASDLDTLEAHIKNAQAPGSLQGVVAKYMLNEIRDPV